MRQAARDYIARTAARIGAWPGPVYEFGSAWVGQRPELVDLRPLFPGSEYHGCDISRGPGVDEFRDIYRTGLPRGAAGVVVIAEIIEHLERPRDALREVARILAPDGWVIATTLFRFPIHEYPGDFWRFTPTGLASVLRAVGPAEIEHDPLDREQCGVYGTARKKGGARC